MGLEEISPASPSAGFSSTSISHLIDASAVIEGSVAPAARGLGGGVEGDTEIQSEVECPNCEDGGTY